VVYRVGAIGDPRLKVGDRVVVFREQVGFGGGVVLTAGSPTWVEILFRSPWPASSTRRR
jgi:hypothetical protein